MTIPRLAPRAILGGLALTTAACTPARLTFRSTPRVPEILRSAGIPGGRVLLRARVDPNGRLAAVRLTPDSGTHQLLTYSLGLALRTATVKPARWAGMAREGRLEVPVRFVVLRAPDPAPVAGPDEQWVRAEGLPTRCPAPTSRAEVVVCQPAPWMRRLVLPH
jgi:TonB family protein